MSNSFDSSKFQELDDLENQLNVIEHSKKRIDDRNDSFSKYDRYTSTKSCSLYQFVSMLQKITERTIAKKRSIIFSPEEGKIPVESFSEQLNSTYITYKLLSRKPLKELTYRFREPIVEYDEHGRALRQGEVLGQKQEVYIQFDFFSSKVTEVEEVMNEFEENMMLYTGHFMKNGVGKIIFHEQLTDEKLNNFRQSTSVRSLVYYVELEKLIERFDEDIISIDVIQK